MGDAILEPGDPESSYLIETIRPGAAAGCPTSSRRSQATRSPSLTRWVKEGAEFDGPSATETPLASLVDVLADLPKVALKAPAADPVASVAFSPDGRTLAAAVGRRSYFTTSRRARSRPRSATIRGPSRRCGSRPTAGRWSRPAAGRACSASITVWDVARRQKRLDVRGHSDAILAAAVAPDGKTLATAGYDQQILIWDLATGKVVRPLKDHSDAVYGLAFSPDGKTLASCAADRTVKLWDWPTGRRTATLSESTGRALRGGLHARRVARPGRRRRSLDPDVAGRAAGRRSRGSSVRPSPTTRRSCGWPSPRDGTIAGLQRRGPDGQALGPRPAEPRRRRSRAGRLGRRRWPLTPDGRRLALGRYDGSLALWDVGDTGIDRGGLVLREPPALGTVGAAARACAQRVAQPPLAARRRAGQHRSR